MKNKNKKKQFADWLIELANRGFGLSTDAFLKSVKKFLDKEARTIPFKTASQESGFGVSSFFLFLPLLLNYLPVYNFDSNFLRFIEQTGISCKSSLQWPHHQSAGDGVVN